MTTEKPAATIREIAALAGVSAGTVSRVMNDKPGVGAATRKRIAELIDEQGFRGDATARQLSTGRSDCIGIVFPLQVSEVIMHPVYPELLGAISDAAQSAGYDVMLFTTKVSGGVDHILDAVRRKRVDGLILPAASSDDPLLRSVVTMSVPTVLVGHRERAEHVTWVDCDHDEALHGLTTRLLNNGRRRLTLVNGPKWISAYRLRSEGFWRAIEDFGSAGIDADELDTDMSYADGSDAGIQILQRDVRPDAILCSADSTAAGVLDALRNAGVNVPDEIALTGFDDIEYAQHTTPALTTVRMPLHATGAASVSLLLGMIAADGASPDPVILPTSLIARTSG